MVQQAPAKKLAGALLKQGYQVGRPQLSVGESLSQSGLHGRYLPCSDVQEAYITCISVEGEDAWMDPKEKKKGTA